MNKTYDVITDRIIDLLEKGTVPWHKSWRAGGMPKNLISKKEYRGINTFLLGCAEHESPYWLTFKQAKDFGGHIQKGEKGYPVVFWKQIEVESEILAENGKIQMKSVPMLRYYTVFNLEQTEGIDKKRIPKTENIADNPFDPIVECEMIVDNMPDPPRIIHKATGASYNTGQDKVKMPRPERFDSPQEYYSTLFHELTHSTGHESRLNRPSMGHFAFGSTSYSKEELIAEMGAAFICGVAGIERSTIDNSASYIAGWLKRLRGDKRVVIHAAAAAQKATDYILNS